MIRILHIVVKAARNWQLQALATQLFHFAIHLARDDAFSHDGLVSRSETSAIVSLVTLNLIDQVEVSGS